MYKKTMPYFFETVQAFLILNLLYFYCFPKISKKFLAAALGVVNKKED